MTYHCSETKKALAGRITEKAAELGLEVRMDYSGRYMFGKTCLGVVGGRFALAELMCSVFGSLRGLCRDSMGKDDVFYWPLIHTEKEAAHDR
jgi:hypothetical protein